MKIELSEIRTDAGTQVRNAISDDTVADYAEAMTEGAKFPPVVCFHDGTTYYLADGFHRVLAAARIGAKDIDADVRKGAQSDAMWYALGANRQNGVRLNRADVRKAIGIALRAFAGKSDREIAAQIGCNHETVGRERSAMESVGEIRQLETRTGKDGKSYKAEHTTRAASDRLPSERAAAGRTEWTDETPDQKEEADTKTDTPKRRGVGVQLANDAIAILQRIPVDDPLRDLGMQTVMQWIKANR